MTSHCETIFDDFSLRRLSSMLKIVTVIFYAAGIIKIEAACVSSCAGKLIFPFSYPSCDSCKKYVTCLFGQLTTHECLLGTVYDERFNLCMLFSGTCTEFSDYVKGSTATTASITTSDLGSLILKPSQAGKTLLQSVYIKVTLRAPLCTVNAPVYRSTPARSKIECGTLCNSDVQCLFFRVEGRMCYMYLPLIPPCDMDIYKYLG